MSKHNILRQSQIQINDLNENDMKNVVSIQRNKRTKKNEKKTARRNINCSIAVYVYVRDCRRRRRIRIKHNIVRISAKTHSPEYVPSVNNAVCVAMAFSVCYLCFGLSRDGTASLPVIERIRCDRANETERDTVLCVHLLKMPKISKDEWC